MAALLLRSPLLAVRRLPNAERRLVHAPQRNLAEKTSLTNPGSCYNIKYNAGLNNTMPVSMQDVAIRANVSAMTVSRVMRGNNSRISEATRQRVLKAAEELDYASLRSSRRRRSRTNIIGVVPTDPNVAAHPIDYLTHHGMLRAARKNQYDLLWVLREEANWKTTDDDSRYPDRATDGFIFISLVSGEWQAVLESVANYGIKTVVCYRRDVPPGIAWVSPDNARIASIAVQKLRRHGHKRIGYMALPGAHASTLIGQSTLQRNYSDLLREQLLIEQAQIAGDVSIETIHGMRPDFTLRDDILDLIAASGITALVAIDMAALLVIDRLRQAGKRVPDDLSIMGIDGFPEGARVELSTIAFEYEQIGEYAVDAVIDQWRGASAVEASRIVPVHYVERKSIGSPKL